MGCANTTGTTEPNIVKTTVAHTEQANTVAPPKVVQAQKLTGSPATTTVQQTKQSVSPQTQAAGKSATVAAGKIATVTPEDVGKYLNQARQNPQSLVLHIEKQLAKFKDKMSMELWAGFNYQTNEGKGAWIQAIDFLKKQKPIQPLTLHRGLSVASTQHAIDLASHDIMGHVGSNGSTVKERIDKYCIYTTGFIGENVAQEFNFAGRDHALEAVISLIIDDGVEDRGHRTSIFDKNYNYFGAASRQSSQYYIIVVNYASENLKERTGVKPPAESTSPSQPKSKPAGGQRVIVSQSSSTETTTKNGVVTKITKTTKKFSDGTTEVEEVRS